MKNIYIVLSQTGTLFSKAIKWYTKDPYTHASISFDQNFDTMYSFGRKHRYNILKNGFVEESFYRGMFTFFPDARCCILEIPVMDEEYDEICKSIEFFQYNKSIYHYNFIGLLGFAADISLSRKNHFFCSQFVSYVLANTSFWDSPAGLTKPTDFFNIAIKTVVFEGFVRDYKIASR